MDNSFIVHKAHCVPTISSISSGSSKSSLYNGDNNSNNGGTGAATKISTIAAGKPSNWEENRKTYNIPGRRSRRNSILDDSQLTLENFGGSQDNFHLLGRNPDKEPAVLVTSNNISSSNGHNGAKIESFYIQQPPPTQSALTPPMVHNLYQDTWNSSSINNCLQAGNDGHYEDDVPQMSITKQDYNTITKTAIGGTTVPSAVGNTITTPNTTTWQKQQQQHQKRQIQVFKRNQKMENNGNSPRDTSPPMLSSEMLNVRLKLEEKRRQIENEKYRMEVNINKQREKLGKAAFMHAVSKDVDLMAGENQWLLEELFNGCSNRRHISEIGSNVEGEPPQLYRMIPTQPSSPPQPFSLNNASINNSNMCAGSVLGGNDSNRHYADANSMPVQSCVINHNYYSSNIVSPTNVVGHRVVSPTLSPALSPTISSYRTPLKHSSSSSCNTTSISSPTDDDMAPQSISFIGSNRDDERQLRQNKLTENLGRLQITSGSRTYRIPSPTRPPSHTTITRNSFLHHQQQPQQINSSRNELENNDSNNENKGFYISFDNDSQPKRPKPPLRIKKSLKKDSVNNNNNSSSSNSSSSSNNNNNNNINNNNNNNNSISNNNSNNLFSRGNGERAPSNEKLSNSLSCSQMIDNRSFKSSKSTNLIIDTNPFIETELAADEMDRKKERILMLSLQRRQQQEEMKARKEIEAQKRKEQEKEKEEAKARKKEEDKQRRNAILERHRLKKAIEEAEREGKPVDKELLNALKMMPPVSNAGPPRLRNRNQPARPRPKTIHVGQRINISGASSSVDAMDSGGSGSQTPSSAARSRKGSSTNLNSSPIGAYSNTMKRDYYRGSQDCLLAETTRTSSSSVFSDAADENCIPQTNSPYRSIDRHGSYRTARDISLDRSTSHIGRPRFGMYQNNPRKSSSLMNLCGLMSDQDNLLYQHGEAGSVRRPSSSSHSRALSPNQSNHSGPGSLPIRKRFDDAASESGGSEYSGPRLYKQPAMKSNRGIILNAVEYCVFPGVVNRESKKRVLEEINRADAKHFLILFRDARCQFRALYAYYPEADDEVFKLYGTGPKQVTDRMFDKFFKYNSGAKCFSQVHTKHLTVTIDAFTIHNSLWQGKRMNLPNKRDMTIVI